MKKAFFFFSAVILLYSCGKKNETYKDETKDYFPLTIGKQVVYDVDSIIWDDFTCKVDTHHYEMRWTVNDTFRDNASRLSYTIDIDIRDSANRDWKIHRVIYVTATETRLEYQEENLRFIKLIFPAKDNRTWNGNAEISVNSPENQYLQLWEYTYANTAKPYGNGLKQFENTITVNQIDKEENDPTIDPYAYKIFGKEVYAKDVGMVYREMIYWVFDENVSKCLSGFGVIMRAKEHN